MQSGPTHTLDLVGLFLRALGAGLIALSIFMLITPGTFFEEISPFSPRNDHFIRDGATFQLALGVLALFAAARPPLRQVAIIVIGLQFFLHAGSHLADISETDPAWLGVANFAFVGGTFLMLVWLFFRARKEAL